MREELVVYYALRVFHNWFSSINEAIGDAPFQSVVQNFLYFPDPGDPDKSRIETFTRQLIKFIDDARITPEPQITPKSLEIKGVTVEQIASEPSVDDYVGDAGCGQPAVTSQDHGGRTDVQP